jgi:hypothetical protein
MPSTPTVSRCAHSISVAPARLALAHHHARPPRRGLEHLGRQPVLLRPGDDEARDLRLAGAAGHERGVDGVDGDQPPGELDDVHAA